MSICELKAAAWDTMVLASWYRFYHEVSTFPAFVTFRVRVAMALCNCLFRYSYADAVSGRRCEWELQIDGQSTRNVGGLAWLPQPDSGDLDGCLVLIYQSMDSTRAIATRSLDGNAWKDFTSPDWGYVLALAFHTGINKLVMVY